MVKMVEMKRREPTDAETARLREAVRELAWGHARMLAGLNRGDPPRSPFDEDALDGAGQRAAVLAQLAALGEVRDLAQQWINMTVTVAGETGASGEAIGKSLGVSRVAVRKKWPDAVSGTRGPRPAVFTTAGSQDWTGLPRPAEQD